MAVQCLSSEAEKAGCSVNLNIYVYLHIKEVLMVLTILVGELMEGKMLPYSKIVLNINDRALYRVASKTKGQNFKT